MPVPILIRFGLLNALIFKLKPFLAGWSDMRNKSSRQRMQSFTRFSAILPLEISGRGLELAQDITGTRQNPLGKPLPFVHQILFLVNDSPRQPAVLQSVHVNSMIKT